MSLREIVFAEHDVSHLSTWRITREEMIQYFGRGINVYFLFVVFIGIINLLLFLVSTIFVLSSAENFLFFTPVQPLAYIYLSCFCFLLLVATVLWLQIVKRQAQQDMGQEIIGNDDIISSFCGLKQKLSPTMLKTFRLVLCLSFVGLFFAYYYCQQALQVWALSNLSTGVRQTIMSIFFVLIDALWRLSCSLLTSLESHKYLSSYQQSDCLKSFVSRVIMFTIWSAVVHLPSGSIGNQSAQMINLLLVNSILGPFVDVISVYLYNKTCFFLCCGATSQLGDAEFKYKFNLADEYTQILFRQYLVNQCLFSIPVASAIGILGCVLEWWTDKYKLINLCKVSERHDLKFRSLVTAFLLVDLLAVFFAYPNGYVFVV